MAADSCPAPGRLLRCRRAEKDVPLAQPRCPEPTAYCEWRQACTIRLLEKEARRSREREGAEAGR